jgi:hypothetical protein
LAESTGIPAPCHEGAWLKSSAEIKADLLTFLKKRGEKSLNPPVSPQREVVFFTKGLFNSLKIPT